MGATIDTTRAHAVQHRGDLTGIFTWVNGERALVITPTYRKGAPWFVVCDSAAALYLDPRYAARKSVEAAEFLGMPGAASRIATMIFDGLEELVTMPSEQPPEKTSATYGEVTMRADGEIVGGSEVRPDKAGGVTYG